ncbi:transporter substrate-binding domain-containing protein [Chromatiaceae bacterium AAb-1]|nr:transporter substrate-binding domain-containing protein [Chromatiaceae bacterium AAb-1]
MLFILLICISNISYATTVVNYPAIAREDDPRSEYPLALLQMALDEAAQDYQLISTESHMSKSRALSFLKENQIVDVVWTMTSREREQDYLPIRIPVFKGLSGYRVLLIHNSSQQKFARDLTIQKIKRLLYAQGHDWVDTSIMRRNGFAVLEASNYEALFFMLEKGRVDAVPRSVAEVLSETAALKLRNIKVEKNWVFYYPTASYFFVNKHNITLARDIEEGLLKLINDGRFDKLFMQTFAAQLTELRLTERNMIILDNPFLPAETPTQNPQLWYYRQQSNMQN